MTIMVTGATGSVGRHVVAELVAAGESVSALTRTPEEASLPEGVPVFAGDLAKPDGLERVFAGVRRLYLFPVPETAREVVAAAVRAGVERIVVLSSSSVLDERPDNHSGQYHRAVERAVEAADVEWTFVRGGEFATNVLLRWGHSIRTENVVRAPYATAARALLHEADVAAVAVAALRFDGHHGKAYELTGPESLTQLQQLNTINEVTRLGIRFEELSPEEGRAQFSRFMPPPVVDMVMKYLAEAVGGPAAVLPTVQEVTGAPARTFGTWVADHASEFAPDPVPAR
ncbi:uncharacterized protein YbjT (DUF2867 family) [Saccharothrix ecbatanensis]|uniref:Uncharacterized protein YbjT (DUF2867 family) n=1 Tax=Saccharothrix ecbatanensis TaxID=1105145 RepID=A0A7W9HHW7_9PSEU|nr:NAD(P)H-binding protein [Saccharothrix ecbatanensis]MBB5802208.1 uncharacterized protein YbjT (DUF2867 family) [Saccharothrix ecbatanensis]